MTFHPNRVTTTRYGQPNITWVLVLRGSILFVLEKHDCIHAILTVHASSYPKNILAIVRLLGKDLRAFDVNTFAIVGAFAANLLPASMLHEQFQPGSSFD